MRKYQHSIIKIPICKLIKLEEEQDEHGNNTANGPHFQEDIQQKKQEEQEELLRMFTKGDSYEEQLKRFAMVVGLTGGWFEESA
uniref:Uncharacterized protein n=1 Tax=Angiostrongylus cantonensis TaxID=6313 RepID=A0A0K0D6X4_ANGCA